MRAVVMLLRAQLRRHWRSWLALAALAMLAGGFVLAAASTARRTAAAFPDFLARHGYDAVIYSAHPLPSLASIPQVATVTAAPGPVEFPGRCDTCRKKIDAGSFGLFEMSPGGLARTVMLLSGRMPDQSRPDEVLASYTLARDNGVRIGSVIETLIPTPAQIRLGRAKVPIAEVPRRPAAGRRPGGDRERVSVRYRRPLRPVRHEGLRGSRESARDAAQRPITYGSAAAPRTCPDSTPRCARCTRWAPTISTTTPPRVQRGIGPQAAGWSALAVLAALAGLAVVGQAAARQFVPDADDRQALSALGLSVRQFVALGLARAALIGALGAAGGRGTRGAAVPADTGRRGTAGHRLAGRRRTRPARGRDGVAATVASLVALSVWPAVRNARLLRASPPRRQRQGSPSQAVARSGASPAAVIGVRYALERGRGQQPVPVGTALLGSVLAVAALCGTAVFGASLAQLISSPALYGIPFQASSATRASGQVRPSPIRS